MTVSARLSAAVAALALAAGAGIGFAPPAAAEATVAFSTGGSSRSAPAPTSQIAGSVSAQSGCVVTGIKLKLSTTEGHPVPGDLTIAGNNQSSQSFNWQPALPKNGRYKITVEASEDRTSPIEGCGGTRTIERDLWLEIAPAPPVLTKTQADTAQRSVTLQWKANSEADLIGYLVYRSYDGGAFEAVGGYAPNDLTHFDRLDEAPGGEYRYEVRAIRPSADWYVNDGTRRPPSASPTGVAASSGSVRMPDPPAPPQGGGGDSGSGSGGGSGTGSGSGSGSTSGGTRSTSGLRTSGKIDFSAFAAELDRVRQAGDNGVPDPGFADRLPFSPRTTVVGEDVPGEALGEPVGSDEDQPTSLLMFAAGLLLTVFVMHLLWLKGEVDRAPLEALPPGAEVIPLAAVAAPPPAEAAPDAPPRVRRRRIAS